MKTSELIQRLQLLQLEMGGDPEVLCQSHDCCSHGHDIEVVERGRPKAGDERRGHGWADEADAIIIRV